MDLLQIGMMAALIPFAFFFWLIAVHRASPPVVEHDRAVPILQPSLIRHTAID